MGVHAPGPHSTPGEAPAPHPQAGDQPPESQRAAIRARRSSLSLSSSYTPRVQPVRKVLVLPCFPEKSTRVAQSCKVCTRCPGPACCGVERILPNLLSFLRFQAAIGFWSCFSPKTESRKSQPTRPSLFSLGSTSNYQTVRGGHGGPNRPRWKASPRQASLPIPKQP